MSWSTTGFVGNDIRQQIALSQTSGHRAGKIFVRQHREKDKIFFGGVLSGIEDSISDMELPKSVDKMWKDGEKSLQENPVAKGMEGLQKVVDPGSWVTDYLKGNLPQACLRASISCAVFHEVKERVVKPAARKSRHKKVEPATAYLFDVMLPGPLYGPFFLFLVGKAREYVVGTTLSAVGLKKD